MSQVDEDGLWARWRAGESLRKIAAGQSMPDQHVRRYLMQCGGIRPAPVRRAELHLSAGEREEVSRALARGYSCRAIGRQLGRSHTSISREVARNGGRGAYRAGPADQAAYVRARRPKASKLATSPRLRAAVEAGLEAEWSPEQISARLRVDHPGDAGMRICHESIYRAIYQPQRKAIKARLHRQLRTARLMRHPKIAAVPTGAGQIRAMVAIGARPAEVEGREVAGHWEGDLVMGTRPSAVATLVERTTRYLRVVALPGGIKAGPVRQALSVNLAGVEAHLLRSITWDRGREMAEHAQLTAEVGAPVFFCAPRSPWQRGTNENTNGLLRQYLAKNADLRAYDQHALDTIAARINARPRRVLGWATPAEAYARLRPPGARKDRPLLPLLEAGGALTP